MKGSVLLLTWSHIRRKCLVVQFEICIFELGEDAEEELDGDGGVS